MGRLLNIVVLVLLVGTIGQGCDPDPLFMDCPLSNSIRAACETESESIVYTCVVAQHPYCLESICASWQGGPSECTLGCDGDADCPMGASCQSHLDLTFCVRNIHLNAYVFDLPDVVPSD